MATYPFSQVDVFGAGPYRGNPVAVVHDADALDARPLGTDALDTEAMRAFARWTNLSETTFLLTPQDPAADYRVRIFTPSEELPFAGHPTLGSAYAWREAGGIPQRGATIVQECGAGLVEVRSDGAHLAFAAPPLVRSGPVSEPEIEHVAEQLGIGRAEIVDAQWVDNGPGWVGVLLADADAVLALRPGTIDVYIGVVGPRPAARPPLGQRGRHHLDRREHQCVHQWSRKY